MYSTVSDNTAMTTDYVSSETYAELFTQPSDKCTVHPFTQPTNSHLTAVEDVCR